MRFLKRLFRRAAPPASGERVPLALWCRGPVLLLLGERALTS
jgi:hypothetical protein